MGNLCRTESVLPTKNGSGNATTGVHPESCSFVGELPTSFCERECKPKFTAVLVLLLLAVVGLIVCVALFVKGEKSVTIRLYLQCYS